MIGLGQFADEGFVCSNGLFLVKRTLSLRCSESGHHDVPNSSCVPRVSRNYHPLSVGTLRAEIRTYEMIHIMGYHGLLANALCNQSIERGTITYRHLREVSTEDTRDVVSGIVFFPPI